MTRGWCIFELYCTIKTNSKFQVAMCDDHLKKFFKDLELEVRHTINEMLATIDARNSQCFKPEDKERIFAAIEGTIGFSKINAMIFDRLRDWVVEIVQVELESRRGQYDQRQLPEEDVMVYVHILAQLYEIQGKYASAEPLYVECLRKRKSILGVDHSDTLLSMNNLATLRGRRKICFGRAAVCGMP